MDSSVTYFLLKGRFWEVDGCRVMCRRCVWDIRVHLFLALGNLTGHSLQIPLLPLQEMQY